MKKKAYISPVIKLHQLSSRVMIIKASQPKVGRNYSTQEEYEDPNGSRSSIDWDDDY